MGHARMWDQPTQHGPRGVPRRVAINGLESDYWALKQTERVRLGPTGELVVVVAVVAASFWRWRVASSGKEGPVADLWKGKIVFVSFSK